MAIIVQNLTATPNTLTVGDNSVSFSYEGFVDDNNENPVIATVTLDDPAAPLFFTATGTKKITLPPKKFSVNAFQTMTDVLDITLTASGGGVTPCQVTFVFTTKSGSTATVFAFLFY